MMNRQEEIWTIQNKMINNEAQSANNWEKVGMIKMKKMVLKIIDEIKFQTIHSGDEGTSCYIDVVSVEHLKRELGW